jgi:hypothetical protein
MVAVAFQLPVDGCDLLWTIMLHMRCTKAPDLPVFYTLVICFLKELRKGTAVDIKADMDWSVRLPDGRHVYRDDDDPDVFWVAPDEDSKHKSFTLEANLTPLV